MRSCHPRDACLPSARAEDHAAWLLGILRFERSQVRAHPESDSEWLISFHVAGVGQIEPSRRVHSHVGPEQNSLTPNHRAFGGGNCAKLGFRSRVCEVHSSLFVEPKTYLQSGRTDRLCLRLRVLEPSGYKLAASCTPLVDLVFDSGALRQNLFVGRAIVILWHTDERRPVLPIIIRRILGQVVEESREPVKIVTRDGIELVIMADGASSRQPHEGSSEGLGAFAFVIHPQFFDEGSAFTRTDAGSEKCGRDD